MKRFISNTINLDTVFGIKKWGAFLAFVLTSTLVHATSIAVEDEASIFMADSTKFWLLSGMLTFQVILLFTISGIIKNLAGNRKLWTKIINKNSAAGVITLLFVVMGSPLFAADSGSGSAASFVMSESIENLLISLNVFLLLVIVVLLVVLKSLLRALSGVHKLAAEEDTEDFWSKFMVKMTDAVPVEREEEVMTDHDYDGIYELDNNLPPWWLLGFYISIFASVAYIGYYHIYLDGKTMNNEFVAEMKQAEIDKAAYLAKLGNLVDETNVELLTGNLDKGAKIYTDNCAACHGGAGEGGIGPNLTDKYWLHGGGIKNVFSTIKYGVIEKGMISWKDQLTPPDMQQVASYIISLEGTNPPNGKEPQGDEWKEETTTTDTTSVVEPEVEEVAAIN